MRAKKTIQIKIKNYIVTKLNIWKKQLKNILYKIFKNLYIIKLLVFFENNNIYTFFKKKWFAIVY